MIFAQKPDRYVIYWNENRGSVRCELRGYWSIEDAEDYYPLVGELIERSRLRHGIALILFDLTESEIASGALIENFQAGGSKFISPSDRVALVYSSALLKIQIKRTTPVEGNVEYFASLNAADVWLHAHVHAQ